MDDEQLLKEYIEKYLNRTVVTNDGSFYFIKELVGRIRNLKIEIYSNDHNPPHFHVKSNDNSINATIRLDNGELLQGSINSKDKKRIQKFFEDDFNKKLMKNMWNKSKSENKKLK